MSNEKTGKTLNDVKEVYSGFEGALWELIMGEQIHIGGYPSSKALGDSAKWKEGEKSSTYAVLSAPD